MSQDRNPFIQDPERLQTSSRRSWFCERVIGPCSAILVGAIGLVVLIYVMATLNPLGFSALNQDTHEDPYNVSRPIRRWPVAMLGNNTYSTTSLGTKLETPTTTMDRLHQSPRDSDSGDHEAPFNEPLITTGAPITEKYPYTTDQATISHFDWTSAVSTTETINVSVHSQDAMTQSNTRDPLEAQLYSIEYPHVPPPAMCIPSRMSQDVFLDKQWYCHYCWQEAQNGTYDTTAKSETEYRFRCHSNCYNNYAFHSCAIHLYQVETHLPSNGSVRKCLYCKRHMLNALNRTTTKQ